MRKKLQIVLLTAMAVGLPWGAYVFSKPPKPDPSPKKITPSQKSTEPKESSEKSVCPAEPPCPAKSKRKKFTAADYAQHIEQLKKNPPVENLTYVATPPFVVVGNESPATVRKRATGTVRWATRMYKKDYFRHDPAVIYTIWLLKDKKTYEAATKKLCRYAPGTPFGFFSPARRVLVMNIATGGGTLVHEMFHAFVPANFPDLPSWLNEGIASLYEQSGQRDGKIVGFTNWRLKGLKAAIRAKKTISLKKLTHTTTAEFYGPGSDVHYAMARYLCYYLQENGKLRKYYHAFYKNRKTDPTGYKTLVEILGNPADMEKFQKDWQAWCMALQFP